jgi:Domain of unknown function (DUF2760)
LHDPAYLSPNPAIVFYMAQQIGFWDRLKLGWRVIVSAAFAAGITEALEQLERARSKRAEPPERLHASGLVLLAALQREGRLVDFLQQDAAGFSDEEIGAAARIVHGGCRKALRQFFEIKPATDGSEGSTITVAAGFDAQRIRLTGNVSGQPPFKGTLRHHGWIATEIRMPAISEALDPRVISPAEVELA